MRSVICKIEIKNRNSGKIVTIEKSGFGCHSTSFQFPLGFLHEGFLLVMELIAFKRSSRNCAELTDFTKKTEYLIHTVAVLKGCKYHSCIIMQLSVLQEWKISVICSCKIKCFHLNFTFCEAEWCNSSCLNSLIKLQTSTKYCFFAAISGLYQPNHLLFTSHTCASKMCPQGISDTTFSFKAYTFC